MDPQLQLRLDSLVLNATPSCSSSAEFTRNLPWHLASALRDVLIRAPAELLNPSILSELRSIIRTRQIPNYEQHWAAFAYLYYCENFQKAYLAAHCFLSRSFDRALRIIDLGCGGGASTAGVICALQATGPHPPLIEKTIGVDTSPSQLELFHQTVKRWLNLDQPSIIVETYNQDIIQFLREADFEADIAIASYLLVELDPQKQEEFRHLLQARMRSSGGQILIIDDDTAGTGVAVETIDGSVRQLDDSLIENSSSPRTYSTDLTSIASSSPFASKPLLDYFQAWETHDIETIRRIFSLDAVYEILGSKTLRGISEIEAYWACNERLQRNVRCRVLRSYCAEEAIVSAWTAEFLRVDKGAWYILHGLMWLTIRDGRIVHLIESFAKHIQQQ